MSSTNSLNVLHVASVGRATFGVGAAVLGLTGAQRTRGMKPTIWSTDSEREGREIRLRLGLAATELVTYPVVGPSRLAFSPAMERAARNVTADDLDVCHHHGIWTAHARATCLWRGRCGRPTVVAAHGELERWALRRSRVKKWLARQAYAGDMLKTASCMHALSRVEMVGYRQYGLKNPVAVISNGVDEEWLNSEGCASRFRDRFQLPQDRRVILFLSRITPVKGLPLLLEALAELRAKLHDWLVVIAGPDEFSHMAEIQARVDMLGIHSLIRFTGAVFGQDRRDAFAAAELLVLPTHREGVPMCVLEALGARVPVLTTHGAPCDYLVTRGCGWWTPVDATAIREALLDAVARPPEELVRMGDRGHALVGEQFTWPIMAERTHRLYQWLLGRGERPEFVVVD
jgi:glycosyltransferase involved in cell wall biosynthesis